MDIYNANIPLVATLYKVEQDDNGDYIRKGVVDTIKLRGEHKKQTTKDFLSHSLSTSTQDLVFAVNYRSAKNIHTGYVIDFMGKEYEITAVEHDYSGKDYTLIKISRVGG